MRASGILLHVSSLPGGYGIGTLGKEAYRFVDFLSKANQKYWQVLPLGPTSFGDSPYQTFSAFAGNPYFIDLDLLVEDDLLTTDDCRILMTKPIDKVDYAHQYRYRILMLKKAYNQFVHNTQLSEFYDFKLKHSDWLEDYALFMAIKYQKPEADWSKWKPEYKNRNKRALALFANSHHQEIDFWKFVQYKFFMQWLRLKEYANAHNVQIIGDMPIYVSYDSADVWARPEYWQLDEGLKPTVVAGVPPDFYAKTGQLWGNPIYDYDLMEQDGFSWWIKRMKSGFEIFDVIRIDHFRGFEAYYAVPTPAKDATNGQWIKGPGYKLFSHLKAVLGNGKIIAEDLGFLTPSVYELLAACGYPGMKILQFGFDHREDSEYAPHNYSYNSVAYPGTHDNSTLKGWLKNLNKEDYRYFCDYMQVKNRRKAVDRAIIECFKSPCWLSIIPIQDYLRLDDRARFNIPSTLGGNWVWRLKPGILTEKLAARIRRLTRLYRRYKN
ncbi:MAG: 4-alpha-glucanotransferase [Bacilli bacterium]|nr:4-alpha-glucanotransferase [Bacilli bacterium]MDD4388724.1 4-alpha-glucanotransferase [Bacilli bacterium]